MAVISFRKGDILKANAEALVNTVNCVGAMGRGVALQFRRAFPENFRAYAAACARREVRPGQMFVFETGALTNPHLIINFPTKRHWRGKSRLEDIRAGLRDLARVISERRIRSIAVPALGSGLGGLDWDEVRPYIEETLRSFNDLDAVIFEPGGAPDAKRMAHTPEAPAMTAGRAALVGLMDRYRQVLLDPFITLLEVHKLMYFMQVAGEPLKFRYAKAPYGPYAENLRHVLNTMEGHFISGYGDGGDEPDRELVIVPGAVESATRVLSDAHETRERFERVADLINGFESAFGLELLSTVHWVLTHDAPASVDELTATTYAWNERKKRFCPEQIALAANMLTKKGWITGINAVQ